MIWIVSLISLLKSVSYCLVCLTLLLFLESAECDSFLYPSVHQLQLASREGQHPADIVCDPQGKKSDDHKKQQHPPEAQILHKLLPGCAEAGQNTLTALQVGV